MRKGKHITLDVDLLETLELKAEKNSRSLSREIEHRLKRSLR